MLTNYGAGGVFLFSLRDGMAPDCQKKKQVHNYLSHQSINDWLPDNKSSDVLAQSTTSHINHNITSCSMGIVPFALPLNQSTGHVLTMLWSPRYSFCSHVLFPFLYTLHFSINHESHNRRFQPGTLVPQDQALHIFYPRIFNHPYSVYHHHSCVCVRVRVRISGDGSIGQIYLC